MCDGLFPCVYSFKKSGSMKDPVSIPSGTRVVPSIGFQCRFSVHRISELEIT